MGNMKLSVIKRYDHAIVSIDQHGAVGFFQDSSIARQVSNFLNNSDSKVKEKLIEKAATEIELSGDRESIIEILTRLTGQSGCTRSLAPKTIRLAS